jgi:hypothetical protein
MQFKVINPRSPFYGIPANAGVPFDKPAVLRVKIEGPPCTKEIAF